MPLTFPGSPSPGDVYTSGGRSWAWDGTSWNLVSLSGLAAGGALEGTYPNPTLAPAAVADKQPLDSNLTDISELTTTSFGRALLELANAAALRAAANAVSALAVPTMPRVVGSYYGPAGVARVSTGHSVNASGVLVLGPPTFLQAGAYDRITLRTNVAAISTWRLGLYSTNATTILPDGESVLLDAGTINMNQTAGVLEITIAYTLPNDGIYYPAVLCDAYTATPSVYGMSGDTTTIAGAPAPMVLGIPSTTFPFIQSFRRATGVVTGALPATCPATVAASHGPYIGLRAA